MKSAECRVQSAECSVADKLGFIGEGASAEFRVQNAELRTIFALRKFPIDLLFLFENKRF